MELSLTADKKNTEDLDLDTLSHLNTLKKELLDRQPLFAEKSGMKVYQNIPVLRDVATVMEYPEFYSFYEKYLSNPEKNEQILFVLKIYYWISRFFPEKYNAYHKLFVLYALLHNPEYSQLIFEKVKAIENGK